MILERTHFGATCVMGRLYFGGDSVFTIERPWLQNKPWESCIPDGEYALNAYSSAKYPNVWQVGSVPGRTHILIHAANYADQLAGCIAPGLSSTIREPWDDDRGCAVWSSRKACERVFEYLVSQSAPRLTIKSASAPLEECV